MKKMLAMCVGMVIAALFISDAFAGAVDGYFRKNGTYVQPHYRSNPNNTPIDNYNFKGNKNPYNGKPGTNYYRDNPKSPYYNPYRSNY